MYYTVGTESIQPPLIFTLILQPFAKITIFFPLNVHTAAHIDRKTQNLHFCSFIKKEKLKYLMVISI